MIMGFDPPSAVNKNRDSGKQHKSASRVPP
jgi:hypothetical protein